MKRKIVKIITAVLALLMAGAAFFFILKDRNDINITEDDSRDYHLLEYEGKTYRYNTDIISILLMGIDSTDNTDGQTDHMSLLIIDRGKKEIKLLAIPRETITDIEIYSEEGEYLGESKTFLGLAYPNGAHAGKGAVKAMEAVSRLFNDVPIIYYAAGNMNVMDRLIEITGPVDITLPDDSLAFMNEEWVTGYVFNVNKDTIETFLRSRDTSEKFTNTNRMARQNLYLEILFDTIKDINEKDTSFLFDMAEDMLSDSNSNISLDEAETICDLLMECSKSDPFVYTLQGRYASGPFYDEFYPNENSLLSLITELFYVEDKEV